MQVGQPSAGASWVTLLLVTRTAARATWCGQGSGDPEVNAGQAKMGAALWSRSGSTGLHHWTFLTFLGGSLGEEVLNHR